jgi:hypothetical protein
MENMVKHFISLILFVFITVVVLVSNAQYHELAHQQIFEQGCINASVSIHYSLSEFETQLDDNDGCRADVGLANMLNDVVGYNTSLPLAMMCGLLAAILFELSIKE